MDNFKFMHGNIHCVILVYLLDTTIGNYWMNVNYSNAYVCIILVTGENCYMSLRLKYNNERNTHKSTGQFHGFKSYFTHSVYDKCLW